MLLHIGTFGRHHKTAIILIEVHYSTNISYLLFNNCCMIKGKSNIIIYKNLLCFDKTGYLLIKSFQEQKELKPPEFTTARL